MRSMETVHLVYPDRWKIDGGIYATGRAFLDEEYRDTDGLVDLFDSIRSFTDFASVAKKLNGCYAVIVDTDDWTYAATDHARTVPLFYDVGDRPVVSDSARWLREQSGVREYDPIAESEFALAQYVTGRNTLFSNTKTLRAGEAVRIGRSETPAGIDVRRYYSYIPRGKNSRNETELLRRLDQTLTNAVDRLVEVADGRPIAVPLSGGYDSRLVIVLLKSVGYEEVVAFSFGRSGNDDAAVSKQVAATLDVPWEFVEYTPDSWHEWFSSDDRKAYYNRSFNYDSIPNMGMMPAARALLDSGRLPADTIFCPGQTVATPSEHIPERTSPRMDTKDVIEYIIDRHFSLWNWSNDAFREIEHQRIADALPTSGVVSLSDAAAAYEKWEWEERQAKFINGDVRQYEFLNADWWLPLWDREFVDFWATVPLEHRRDKALLRNYVAKKYAEIADIPVRKAKISNQHRGIVNRVKTRVSDSSLKPVLRPIYRWAVNDEAALSGEHWGWYGIVPDEQLDELRAAASNVYSFRVLEALGRLSFDPPRQEPGLLQGNELTLPVNERTEYKSNQQI